MDDWNNKLLFYELYSVALGISVIMYFRLSNDYHSLALITKWSIICIFVTAIMSVISSVIYPSYARDLTGLSSFNDIKEVEGILYMKKFGGGTYSTAGAFMSLFPIVIYYLKNRRLNVFSQKQAIAFAIVLFSALLGMQIFGNIIISLVFATLAIFGMKKMSYSFLLSAILLYFIISIPKDFYANSLVSISNRFESLSELNYKIKDVAQFVNSNTDLDESETGIGIRLERYPKLFGTFIKSPFFGCYFLSNSDGNGYIGEGGHLHWMNKLTVTGIFGLSMFLIIPFKFMKQNIKRLDPGYRFYYILASFSILSYGLIKGLGGRDTWYAFFILIPGLYYLPLLKKREKNQGNAPLKQ